MILIIISNTQPNYKHENLEFYFICQYIIKYTDKMLGNLIYLFINNNSDKCIYLKTTHKYMSTYTDKFASKK